jgi:hypothetical protein
LTVTVAVWLLTVWPGFGLTTAERFCFFLFFFDDCSPAATRSSEGVPAEAGTLKAVPRRARVAVVAVRVLLIGYLSPW